VATTERGSNSRAPPAEPVATSVPAPIAMPTSALASAGASLTPSPTMPTTRPSLWARRPRRLVLGPHAGEERRMPSSAATEAATASASPVIMTTSMPRLCSACTVVRDSSRIASASEARRDDAVDEHVQDDRALARHCRRPPSRRAGAGEQSGPPTSTMRPATVAHPGAGSEESDASAAAAPVAAVRIAASGCSESASAEAATASTSSSVTGSGGHRGHEARPSVSVPVLSNSTVSTVRILRAPSGP
jgi:hypothetical protein